MSIRNLGILCIGLTRKFAILNMRIIDSKHSFAHDIHVQRASIAAFSFRGSIAADSAHL